ASGSVLSSMVLVCYVIVTSYVFRDGRVDWERLRELVRAVGRDRLVLDLSCRRKGDTYYIVTDRWQRFTDVALSSAVFDELAAYCAEFLIHAADVEGLSRGIERPLVRMLGDWAGIPVTYAGGVGSYEDLRELKELGQGRLNVTVGSALDRFGGPLNYKEIMKFIAQ
ncbi:MAG: phosphoribosylformimino-5-aminoimidazole carboxamide ribotide isomerase, partial [Lachnospiraceae bacterium]|nr:phosphoribosylformimino-5-aminoimidazole carboxamide ribotide isomerase [Lachnospiraceae bacterium]